MKMMKKHRVHTAVRLFVLNIKLAPSMFDVQVVLKEKPHITNEDILLGETPHKNNSR
jgi:hypothetical protein